MKADASSLEENHSGFYASPRRQLWVLRIPRNTNMQLEEADIASKHPATSGMGVGCMWRAQAPM